MAKFRRNHDAQGSSSTIIVRVILFAAILGGLLWMSGLLSGLSPKIVKTGYDVPPVTSHQTEDLYFLPTSTTGDLIHRKYYSLSYSEKHEQAEWVAYELTREQLNVKWVERQDNFRSDPVVATQSATPQDYRRSGYDRGHLVPVADRSFSFEAMDETFFMSNISPQEHTFNGGIWRELEENTRNWAKKFKRLYIVSGPVFPKGQSKTIGQNKVTVPEAYFKVLLDITEPELKGIAFLIPNKISYEPLAKYAVSIDEVEAVTGLNFFPSLLSEELETELEQNFDSDLWPYSQKKFNLRLEKWNKW